MERRGGAEKDANENLCQKMPITDIDVHAKRSIKDKSPQNVQLSFGPANGAMMRKCSDPREKYTTGRMGTEE